MRKRQMIFCCVLFLLGACLSCERPLTYQLDANAGIPVFYGILSPEEIPQFQLFETLGALDTGAYPIISDAEILLIENQTDTIHFVYNQSERYEPVSLWKPKVGRNYHVQIYIPGGEVISSSEVRIPAEVKLAGVEFADSVSSSGNNGEGILTLRITPPPAASVGLYHLEVEGSAGSDAEKIFPLMLDLPQEIGSVCDIFDEVFSDQCFDSPRTWKWRINTTFFISGQGIVEVDHLRILMSSVSLDYFEYLSSRRNQIDGFEALFIRADQVHSNISGGLGILGARQTELIEIDL